MATLSQIGDSDIGCPISSCLNLEGTLQRRAYRITTFIRKSTQLSTGRTRITYLFRSSPRYPNSHTLLIALWKELTCALCMKF
jgi:hypothetical protein